MATYTKTGTTGNDTYTLGTFNGSKPSSGNIYIWDALAGTDTLRMGDGTSYLNRYNSTNFTIQPADANGFIVVTGASTGGTTLTLQLKNVEALVFNDKTVSLSYGPVADTTPPTLTSSTPADAATGVAISSNIDLTFSETIQLGTGAIEIHSGSATGTLVASSANGTLATSVSGSTLTINPTADLANNTQYFVTLAAGSVKDAAGNSYAGISTYDFTTIAAADTTPPTFVSSTPTVAATGVANNSDIVLTFSEAIQLGTGAIEIHSGSATGAVVASSAAGTLTATVSGSTLTINPTADLGSLTHYYVTLAAGAVKDIAGNSVAAATTNDFTTATDTTPPTVTTFSPAAAATGVAVNSDIVLTFSEAIQKGAGAIEIHSGSATGALVASYDAATSSNLTFSGNTLTINPTENLASDTHYFVTLAAGSVHDTAATPNSLAAISNYDFTTVDTIAPTVSSFSPADAATDVAITNDIVVTFSEAVQKGTGLIELHSGSATGAIVAGYDAATSTNLTFSGSVLTINPTADLANNTHYFVTFASGSVKDLAGNSYAGTTTYEFTTIPDTTAPTVTTFNPADAATGVAAGSNLVLTFSEAIAKGTGMIAIHSGSATGTLVESFNVATDTTHLTISGSTLTINPTADLSNSTHYYVTLDQGSIDDLAGNHFAGSTTYDFTTADPYAGGSGVGAGVAVAGVGALGLLAWVLL
jgi:methionine-rich copper-binding protein CopC